MIDLRSDTCSRPTEAMRCAMAEAVVGDDVYSDDPTVRLLEERTAALLGKEDAVCLVTGPMTNQVAPVGSCLAGPKTFIDRARRFKQQFGGDFRQAGIIAAGALYALEHHRSLLGETHTHAANFARKMAAYPEVDIDSATVETNIVHFRLRGIPAGEFVEQAHRLGVLMLPSGPNAVRAVFYLDITDSDVERASELVGEALHSLKRQPEETLSTTSAQY